MYILLLPIIIAEVLFWTILIYFVWRMFWSFKAGNWSGVAFWAVLFSLPFAYYQYAHLQADMRDAARAAEVAFFETSKITNDHPKLLEFYGHISASERLIALGALGFKEIVVFQRPHREEIRGEFVTLAPGCKQHAREKIEIWHKRGRFRAPTKEDKACLIGEWKTVAADRSMISAVEYRQGTQVTLLQPGNNFYNAGLEIRVRNQEGSKLVAYWERPYNSRPSWPGPWGYAYPSYSGSERYKEPGRLQFLLDAMEIK